MGVKRANEEINAVSEKKNKIETSFSMEVFLRNLKDPESSFLGKNIRLFAEWMDDDHFVVALSEFNEYIRHLTSEESVDELVQSMKSNLDDILVLITEEKRKASEVSPIPSSIHSHPSISEHHTLSFSHNTYGIFLSKRSLQSFGDDHQKIPLNPHVNSHGLLHVIQS